jgi:ubiquinone/menaquinone biosynthesis C-methylase UbiE
MIRRLFAALYDTVGKGSEEAGMREERRKLLAEAQGATIEIGAGTGLNVQHYPDAVTRLVLAEPDRHMRVRLGRRVDELLPTAEIVDASAERLPFPDATFDTAVVTFVLCTVPDQQGALLEIVDSGALLNMAGVSDYGHERNTQESFTKDSVELQTVELLRAGARQ